MRLSGLTLGAIALAASVAAPSSANAQRNSQRSLRRPAASSAVRSASQPCNSDCGSYSLAVVSALLPVATAGTTADVVTLVIENRGTAPAPVSVISVAPQHHLVAARRSTIPALAPGARVTVQLPVETGPDGTQCISITMTPAPTATPATTQFLASAIPHLNGSAIVAPKLAGWSPLPELPYWPDFPDIAILPDDGALGDLGTLSLFNGYALL